MDGSFFENNGCSDASSRAISDAIDVKKLGINIDIVPFAGDNSGNLTGTVDDDSVTTNGAVRHEAASLNNILTDCPEMALQDDLLVSVDKPEKVLATMDTYVTFRVSCLSKRADFPSECSVRRRYSDFVFLRNRLDQQFPLLLLPPLPEKHFGVYSLDRYDPLFIKNRMLCLDIFLKRLAQHPVTSNHSDLKLFLSANAEAWSAHKRTGSSLLKPNSIDAFQNIATQCFSFTRDKEFAGHMEYVFALGQRLLSVEKALVRVFKRDGDYVQDFTSLCTVVSHWSQTETGSELRRCLVPFANALQSSLTAYDACKQCFGPTLAIPLHEWIYFTEAVKKILKRREYIEMEHSTNAETLEKKKAERDQMSCLQNGEKPHASTGWFGRASDVESAREQKHQKLTQQIDELTKKVLKYNTQLVQANGELRLELKKWMKLKDDDLRGWMTTFARQKVEYHKESLQAWEQCLQAFDIHDTGPASSAN